MELDSLVEENDWNWIEAGQSITCDSGHIIATAREGVKLGGPDEWMEKLDWRGTMPTKGSDTGCPICHKVWMLHERQPAGWPGLYFRRTWICIDGVWRGVWRLPLTPEARAYVDSQGATSRVH